MRHPLVAVFGRDDEADDRPDRKVVDRLHHAGPFEFPIDLARAERDPADRRAAVVTDEADELALADARLQVQPVLLPARAAPRRRGLRAAIPVEEAPAAARYGTTPGVEDRLEVGEASWSK